MGGVSSGGDLVGESVRDERASSPRPRLGERLQLWRGPSCDRADNVGVP